MFQENRVQIKKHNINNEVHTSVPIYLNMSTANI